MTNKQITRDTAFIFFINKKTTSMIYIVNKFTIHTKSNAS